MEFTKKMILVDPDTIHRINQQENVQPNTLSLLDQEMKDIINNNKISDYEKWTLYNQVLQRYLNIVNNTRKPFSLSVVEEKINNNNTKFEDTKFLGVSESNSQHDYDREILESVPKTYRNRASLLLQKLKRDGPIKWDEHGVVYVNDNKIMNSNITDLLNDVVRPRKTGDPIGWREFTTALSAINTPFELIGNFKRRDYIRQLFESTPINSPETSLVNTSYESVNETPVTPVEQRKSISNLSKADWLPFKL